ncbi:MAG: 30S ribosomal protein S3 [Candidatus Thermofonsia Clade 1 bacterium]|jgi:small subunit ribosomal protein S3|uniref:Small ribosomal subunit protein uS3 n=1 Tax=Candidatus Thermofonsia Clade 1 bacterium TaxID=2364210 RepID=A0A2M8PYL9_9CHLR|nr:MAG: 30S ribosomal protein S3 [Candidatus Thermofonsia Clade 1 bacterium]PJF42629.1 MAG: 30S ribosomal protein S3 [Candidatus Thermofonsia Clade 1 bacterium]RMF51627.1 MAG: 30S ribosomal protein S3 [Chloroflexota bacterium]
MGRKVHPIGFRLKINRTWEGRWYAEGERYRDMLHEDFRIRQWLKKNKKGMGISRVEISRYPAQLVVNIHTARPGVLIGRKGEQVAELRQALEKLTDKKVKIEVTEIEKPDLDPVLVAENIAQQLEKRIGHSRAIKRAIQQAMRQGAQGIKIMVNGRLAGADMARREWQSEGRVPRSTLRAYLDYGTAEALTTYGRIGIKVWIYTGEKLLEEETTAAPN